MDVTYIKHHNGVVHQSGGLCAVSISIEGLHLNIKRVKCRHMFKNLLSLMQLFLILNLKKKETNFSFLVNINEIFLQLQVKSKIKLVFVAKIVFVRCGKMYLQELEACRGEVEQVDNGFGRGFVSHPQQMVGRRIP